MAPKTILLTTDLSCRCDRALDRASRLAAEWGAKLVVLHVMENSLSMSDLPSWRRGPDPRVIAEKRVRRDLRGAQSLDIEVVVEKGNPFIAALEVIRRHSCELVITGVARDQSLGRMLVGSLVSNLASKANVPVLVVKERPRGDYHRMIMASNLSETSRSSIESALTLFPKVRATLFHVYSSLFDGFTGGANDEHRLAAAAEAMSSGKELLASIPAAASRNIPVICEHGEIGELLEDLVNASETDLVVLGTAGRRGLSNMLIGSTAEYLLARLPVDVLLVRDFRTETSA